jgi:hypothetical protein
MKRYTDAFLYLVSEPQIFAEQAANKKADYMQANGGIQARGRKTKT